MTAHTVRISRVLLSSLAAIALIVALTAPSAHAGRASLSVTWTTPKNSAVVSGVLNESSGNCDVAATASRGVAKVVMYADGALLNTELSPPYACLWDTTTVPNGLHTLKAVMYDTAGASKSAQISVNVQNALGSSTTTTTPPTTSTTPTTTTTTTTPAPVVPTVVASPFAGLPYSAGTVAKADYGLTANPLSAWNSISNGYFLGMPSAYSDAADSHHNYSATGGPSAPAFDGKIHSGFRNLNTFGLQAQWDLANQPDSTRSQLGQWSATEGFYRMPVGQRFLVSMAVRLDPNSALPYDISTGGGNVKYSQVFQMKSTGSSIVGPVFAMTEGRNGVKLVYNINGVLREHVISSATGFTVPRGKWLHLALDMNVSTGSDGAYRLWGDFDGNNTTSWKPLTAKISAPTAAAGMSYNVMNLGPYHKTTLPANGRDYANVEILAHNQNDAW